ncbi:MAG: DUF4157 domain-containing protein, partial [Syntrophomonadaceae bacterium]|nr:DUF4157 domain-containing protein [Syntrophomonadaceae bacterium]
MSERQGMTQQETTNKSNQTSHSTQNSKQTQYDQEHKDQSDSGALERIIADPFAASAKDMLTMQGVLGNRILGHIIQAKLTVGTAGNYYEQEADRVAEQVIKQTAAATPSNLNITSKKPSITPFVHSTPAAMTSSDETSPQGFEVANIWESRLKTSKNTGNPLPDNTRHLMESQMGADFSQVRVHTGFAAAHLNQEINAEAFTYGNDIYMADGRYQPQSQSGQQLLAHELTHVVQQSAHSDGQQSPTVQRNWLSRLFSRKKKNHESKPAPQPSSTATATPPPTIKWAGAQSSAVSRPARPSIGTSRVPQRPAPASETSIDPAPRTPHADSHYLPGGFDQLGSSSGSDSGTYTTPVAEEHASDSGSYTTPVAEEHASDSGSYTTPIADDHAPGVSTPAPRNARPDSHYLPGGFDQLGSSSSSSSGSGAYVTPEE